jgi:hypothetical protein
MSADDPIIVSTENRLERDSTNAIDKILKPWRIAWVDQRDDIGRDGFVQIMVVDGIVTRAAPETCAIQAKATASALPRNAGAVVETRHLALWSDDNAPPILIALWSNRSQELRIRTAREVMLNVQVQSPNWRSQGEVSIPLRPEHAVPDARSLDSIRRQISDELDAKGGRTKYHSARRRLLLPQIFIDGGETAAHLELETRKEGPNVNVFIGGGWNGHDVDPADTDARRIFLSALLLYEEIWMPLSLTSTVLRLIGRARFERLLLESRLILYASYATGTFSHATGYVLGGLVAFEGPSSPEERFANWAKNIEKTCRSKGLATLLERHMRRLGCAEIERALIDTQSDLKREDIRNALGVGPSPWQRLPIWDQELYGRLLHLNIATAIAAEHGIDVIDHEAGLSWLASLKLVAANFVRNHSTARGIDEAFAANDLPDIGRLYQAVGWEQSLDLALDPAAQGFRDWYWELCAPMWNNEGPIKEQFRQEARKVLGIDARAMHFSERLRFAYLLRTGEQNAILATPTHGARGFVRRVSSGERTLARQREKQRALRRQRFRQHFGTEPEAYAACLCGSGEKFRFCCGRRD